MKKVILFFATILVVTTCFSQKPEEENRLNEQFQQWKKEILEKNCPCLNQKHYPEIQSQPKQVQPVVRKKKQGTVVPGVTNNSFYLLLERYPNHLFPGFETRDQSNTLNQQISFPNYPYYRDEPKTFITNNYYGTPNQAQPIQQGYPIMSDRGFLDFLGTLLLIALGVLLLVFLFRSLPPARTSTTSADDEVKIITALGKHPHGAKYERKGKDATINLFAPKPQPKDVVAVPVKEQIKPEENKLEVNEMKEKVKNESDPAQ